jgi:hypothetical protein
MSSHQVGVTASLHSSATIASVKSNSDFSGSGLEYVMDPAAINAEAIPGADTSDCHDNVMNQGQYFSICSWVEPHHVWDVMGSQAVIISFGKDARRQLNTIHREKVPALVSAKSGIM